MKPISSAFFAFFGVLAVGLFHADVFFPIWLSVTTLGIVSLYYFQLYRQKRLGILLLLILFVYALPFIHIPPYIWFDFDQAPARLWGLVVRQYMTEQRIIELTAMLGAVGGIGMALGVSLNAKKLERDFGRKPDGGARHTRTMALPIWFVWVCFGTALSWLAAPQETIFSAAYTQSKSLLNESNFSSAWMMSFVVMSFCFCDTLLERHRAVKSIKMKLILVALTIIVVFFQLLRGDRAVVPLVFGLALANFYWAAGITRRRTFKLPWKKIGGVAIALVVTSMVVGAVRHSLVGQSLSDALDLLVAMSESGSIGVSNLLHGTWSAVLLTPLSVAGDHIYGLLPLKWGQDYVNLALSLVPGFLADALGYVRPIDANHGPAWEMRFGMGGTHAVVLPFMNFRMSGVLIVPAIWTFIIARIEKSTLRRVSVTNLSLLVIIVMAAPQFLWYGEKSGINAIVLWLVLSLLYRISLGLYPDLGVHHRSSSLGARWVPIQKP